MVLSKADRDKRRALARKMKIQFNLKVTPDMEFQERFQQIKAIGNVKFAEYRTEIEFDPQDEPWRDTIQERARDIQKEVKRCSKDRANESELRFAVERLIFLRFRLDIVCRKCRRRIWQAAWKDAFSLDVLKSDNGIKLLRCQDNCKCHSKHRDDREAQGLSELFHYSLERFFRFQEEDIKEVHPNYQKPDGICWLYRAGRLDRLLGTQSTTPLKTVDEMVGSRPANADAVNVAFPFLLFEAKKPNSADDLESIQLQSCFPIREMLKTQLRLFLSRRDRKFHGARPFVWFISLQGHEANVSGAYWIRNTTQIVLLWSGNIDGRDEALQLLLIVDYVCDWARNEYRMNVIKHLLRLTLDDAPSLRAETATLSDSGSYLQPHGANNKFILNQGLDLVERYSPIPKKEISMVQVLELLDSERLAIRDANYRHFRVCVLQINTDNIEDFFQSERDHKAAQASAKALLKCFIGHDTWRVKIGALKALEKFWVGSHVDQTEPGDKDELFLTRFGIHSYIECRSHSRADKGWEPGNWLQVHELSIIAISEAAIADLDKRAGDKSYRYKIAVQDCPLVSEDCLVHYFTHLKGAPVRQCITAALQQRRIISRSVRRQSPGEIEAGGRYYDMSMGSCRDNDDFYAIQAPRAVYNRHKIGRKEPSETFTWKSPRHLEGSGEKVAPIQQAIKLPLQRSLVHRGDGAVLVTNEAGSCCIFLVELKARGSIYISQAYSISTPVAGPIRRLSPTQPTELDICSFKHDMLSLLRRVMNLVGPILDRRRSLESQLASSSSLLEKIALYLYDDTATTKDPRVQTLLKSFEQTAREYGIKRILRGLISAFENIADDEELEHSSSISELDGDNSTDGDKVNNAGDESTYRETNTNDEDSNDCEDADDDEDEEEDDDDDDDTSRAKVGSGDESEDSEATDNNLIRARETHWKPLTHRFRLHRGNK